MEELYQHYLNHPQLVTDSRAITPGCIFFALKGESFDGNEFALQALQQGASLAVVDNPALKGENGCFYVPDVLKSLQELAKKHRQSFDFPVIGITGTNGKTTTKELIKAVLGQKYNVTATIGNFNNHIGVPLTILSVPKGTEIAIIEMGANHPGEIDFLCNIAMPDYGIITNVGKAHLEGFGSLEGVFRTKTELYRYIQHRKSGKLFVNADYRNLLQAAGDEVLLYATKDDLVDFYGVLVNSDPVLVFQVTKDHTETLIVHTQLAGAYNLENALAAIRIGCYFNIPLELCRQGIESYIPSNKRSQWIKTPLNHVLLDAYNANPTSMRHAISNFIGISADKKMLILGDMLELGTESAAEHAQILELLRKHKNIDVILVGKEFSLADSNQQYRSFLNSSELANYLTENLLQNHHIFIKGSRGIQLEKILPYL